MSEIPVRDKTDRSKPMHYRRSVDQGHDHLANQIMDLREFFLSADFITALVERVLPDNASVEDWRFNSVFTNLLAANAEDALRLGSALNIDNNNIDSVGEFQIKRTSAASEPTLTVGSLEIWRDSALNKIYLVYNDTDEGQKKIELT